MTNDIVGFESMEEYAIDPYFIQTIEDLNNPGNVGRPHILENIY